MCGIAGILGPGSKDRSLAETMVASLYHRGPDDGGIWSDENAGLTLAHRRLAIVDLSPLGHQPMLSSDGRWALAFNGEIYNHAAIRRQLERDGGAPSQGWRGHSDTETLIEAIAARGLDAALDQLVGMFAFALWDRKQRTLHLVRDRFGEKPLYFGMIGRDLMFASELKAFRNHPDFGPEIDQPALAAYLATTAIPAPLSIYRGIHKLLPGCILSLSDFGRAPLPSFPGQSGPGYSYRRYWNYSSVVEAGASDPFGSHDEVLEAVDAALTASIDGQQMADVPIGAFLSGGIDSSTIAALYQRRSGRPISTFTIGFSEPTFDEAPFARAIAQHLGTDHHEMIVTPAEARDVIPRLPTIYDEPFADSSQIPTYIVSQFARQSVTVALSGDGGDELFAGYNRHVIGSRFWASASRWPSWLRKGGGAIAAFAPNAVWEATSAIGGRGAAFGQKLRKGAEVLRNADSLADVYGSFTDEWYGRPSALRSGEAWRPALPSLPPSVGEASAMACWDALTYLPDDILTKVDRASMAVSLETRAPFLDHRVAAVAARIPLSMKIDRRGGKAILRDLLAKEVPTALFERPKTGFGIPVGAWLRGPLRDWAEGLLAAKRLEEGGQFDVAVVRDRWQQHVDGRRDSTSAIWSVLMFEAWRDTV